MRPDPPFKPTILAADDELELLDLLQMMLPMHGYNVHISYCAENIFDMIHELTPDLILLDVDMGKVDGAVVCALIKSNKSTANIPVLLVSADEQLAFISRRCGADGFIKKPFSTDDVDKKLYELVGSKSNSLTASA